MRKYYNVSSGLLVFSSTFSHIQFYIYLIIYVLLLMFKLHSFNETNYFFNKLSSESTKLMKLCVTCFTSYFM